MTKVIQVLVLFICFSSHNLLAQETTASPYDIGSPTLTELWVDPVSGSDSNSGLLANRALQTITAAWNKIPSGTLSGTGYRINLMSGDYPESSIPNYWENKRGTRNFPIILQAVEANGAVLLGDINAYNLRYFYLIDLNIVPNGDTFHCELCQHVLLRGVEFDGGDGAHETIKVNQSKYIYIEDSVISGAGDNAIDFVAVQYGHILTSKISRANDWCVYVKGGSAYITFANNIVFECGTGGFTAGQGTGLEFMVAPWTRYEAYSIKAFNNLFYDIEGASLGVNGGLDILIAYNTSYKIGTRSHVFEAVFGLRSCDGDNAGCAANVAAGGWGPSSTSVPEQNIPNKNVYIFNNIFYNPTGTASAWQHMAVYEPRATASGTNIPSPAKTDQNLRISGNIFWNGTASMPLGIEGIDACADSNPNCNEAQLRSENLFNQIEPVLNDPDNWDFRPASGSELLDQQANNIANFTGTDHQQHPVTEAGNLENQIITDLSGLDRSSTHIPGAYSTVSGDINITPPTGGGGGDSEGPEISNVSYRPERRVMVGKSVLIEATVTDSSVILRVVARVGNQRKRLSQSGDIFRRRIKVDSVGLKTISIRALDNQGNRTRQRVGQVRAY